MKGGEAVETVLYELHFHWGDLPVLLIPLLVGMGFWAVSCGMNRAKEAGKDLTAPVRRDLSHSKGVKWLLRGIALLCGAVIGFGITSMVLGVGNRREKEFAVGDITITLTEGFTKQSYPGCYVAFGSDRVEVYVTRDDLSRPNISVRSSTRAILSPTTALPTASRRWTTASCISSLNRL